MPYDLTSISSLPGIYHVEVVDDVIQATIDAASEDTLAKIIPARLARLEPLEGQDPKHMRVAICLGHSLPIIEEKK